MFFENEPPHHQPAPPRHPRRQRKAVRSHRTRAHGAWTPGGLCGREEQEKRGVPGAAVSCGAIGD